MQRYNFQFTGQRFFRIENGRLAGQVKDVAYQATTTDFWRSMEAVGGPETYHLGGALNCGKGQPGQVAPVSHGCPSALFRGVNILNTQAEGGQCMSASRAAELVERALAAASGPTVAYVTEHAEANLRWAGNALTTNGEMSSTELTVVATAAVDDGTAAGTVSRQVSDAADVRRPRRRGRGGGAVGAAVAGRRTVGGGVGLRRRLRRRAGRHHASRC